MPFRPRPDSFSAAGVDLRSMESAPSSLLHFYGIRILLVCTANVCRSPMAQAILAGMVGRRGVTTEVASAGLLECDRPVAREAIEAVAADAPFLDGYLSRSLAAAEVSSADLVLGMAREHVREVVVLVPEAWNYAFTLKELVRRGEMRAPLGADEPLRAWLAATGVDRQRSDLLGATALDDIADPLGGPPAAFAATAAELRDLCRRLAYLLGI
jgi:protein-tyrosine phosphatase